MIYDKIKAYGFQALSLVLLVLLATQTFRLHYAELREAKAITTLANERASSAEALVASQEETRIAENALSANAAETRKVTNDQVRTLTTQRDVLIKRVRVAEANAATATLVSKVTAATSDRAAPQGNHGGELLSTIGEQDVDEAIRADTIRLHLVACYRQYDQARETLSK